MVFLWKNHHEQTNAAVMEGSDGSAYERKQKKKRKKRSRKKRKGRHRHRDDLDLSSDTSYFANEDTQEMFHDFSLFWQWRKRQKGGRGQSRGAKHEPIFEEDERFADVPTHTSNHEGERQSNANAEVNVLRLSRESMDLLSKESAVGSNSAKKKKSRKRRSRRRRERDDKSNLDVEQILVDGNRLNPDLLDTWSGALQHDNRNDDISLDSLGLNSEYWQQVETDGKREDNSASEAGSDLGLGDSYWENALIPNSDADDDVDVNEHVEPHALRTLVDSNGLDSEKLSVGMEVEARYGGKKQWYKGAIAKVNQDGTYNVKYEDGDHERGVRVDLIRRAL